MTTESVSQAQSIKTESPNLPSQRQAANTSATEPVRQGIGQEESLAKQSGEIPYDIPLEKALDDLLAERNLFDLCWTSQKIRHHTLNYIAAIGVGALLTYFATHSTFAPSDLANMVRSWADLGFGFATSILGFLIAGFTISATLNRPKLYTLMARRLQRKTKLSYLKDNFLRLLRTFIAYFIFSLLCLSIKLLGFPGGPVSVLMEAIYTDPETLARMKEVVVKLAFAWFGGHFMFVLLSLHPFIYNVYTLVMTGVYFGLRFPDDD